MILQDTKNNFSKNVIPSYETSKEINFLGKEIRDFPTKNLEQRFEEIR